MLQQLTHKNTNTKKFHYYILYHNNALYDSTFGKVTFDQNQIQVLDHPPYSLTKALNLPEKSL